MTRLEKKQEFIKALAEWLAGTNQVEMSIRLGMKDKQAEMWSRVRGYTPLFGYPTVEEATEQLTEFLGQEINMDNRQDFQYNIDFLSRDQQIDIMQYAKSICSEWWVDELCCSKSWARKKIEISWKDAIDYFRNAKGF